MRWTGKKAVTKKNTMEVGKTVAVNNNERPTHMKDEGESKQSWLSQNISKAKFYKGLCTEKPWNPEEWSLHSLRLRTDWADGSDGWEEEFV